MKKFILTFTAFFFLTLNLFGQYSGFTVSTWDTRKKQLSLTYFQSTGKIQTLSLEKLDNASLGTNQQRISENGFTLAYVLKNNDIKVVDLTSGQNFLLSDHKKDWGDFTILLNISPEGRYILFYTSKRDSSNKEINYLTLFDSDMKTFTPIKETENCINFATFVKDNNFIFKGFSISIMQPTPRKDNQ